MKRPDSTTKEKNNKHQNHDIDAIVDNNKLAEKTGEFGVIPLEEKQKCNSGSDIKAHEDCIAAGQIEYLTNGFNDLAMRVSKLELMIENLENISDNSNSMLKNSSIVLTQQLNNVARQVEVLSEALRSTPDYNLGKIYNCASCNSTGTISIKVRCTNCGKENWWGYWPKNSSEK